VIHIALNLVFLVPGETGGMETYARELAPRLADLDGLRVTALVNREAAAAGGPWTESMAMEVVPVRASNRLGWVWGEQRHVPRIAARIRADIVHSLASTAPLHGRQRRVTTVHDLNYRTVPEAHFGLRGLGMRALVPAGVRRSHRLIVDSASTKRDLVEHLRARMDRIDVVPLAADSRASTPPTPERELRERLALGTRPVLLSVGARRPHKNAARVLDAVAAIAPERRPTYVLTGYPTSYDSELRTRAVSAGVDAGLVMPDWLDAGDLEGLYSIATAVLVPSLYEGFGLPVLEAMQRGVPVACSDRSSLPEVAGEAAVMFDPEDVGAIRAAIEHLLDDEDERMRLAAAGRAQAASFSWDRTAQLTARSYERALKG
jgi:glycosyltransferase involved in cell wall biosynthesis